MQMSDSDLELEEMFAEARRNPPRPDAALMGRIAADAVRIAEAGSPAWRRLWVLIGGWRAAAGLTAATLTGVWIGFAGVEQIEMLLGPLDYELADLMPGFGVEWEDAG